MSFVKEMRAYCLGSEGRVGMKIVVGRDEEKNLKSYAAKFGTKVHYDVSGEVYSALNAKGVPSWIVLDQENRVRKQFAGLLGGGSMEMRVDQMIDSRLDLGEFM